jgi:hypothetical protein
LYYSGGGNVRQLATLALSSLSPAYAFNLVPGFCSLVHFLCTQFEKINTVEIRKKKNCITVFSNLERIESSVSNAPNRIPIDTRVTELADEKVGVNCVRSVEIIALFHSTEY